MCKSKSLFLIILSSIAFSTLAMDETRDVVSASSITSAASTSNKTIAPSKLPISPMAPSSAAKRACANGTVDIGDTSIHDQILQSIQNLNIDSIQLLLMSPNCLSLTPSQRSNLYDSAQSRENGFVKFSELGAQLAASSTDDALNQTLLHKDHVQKIQSIKAHLGVLRYLKNLQFPQFLFTAQPYTQGPRQSLSFALRSLIMAEQQNILVCCYHLNLFNIVEALIAKKGESIGIEFIADKDFNSSCRAAGNKLAHGGISILVPRNSDREMMHHKFFIFNRNVFNKPLLWTGSYNPTLHSDEHGWDDATITDNTTQIEAFIARFNTIKAISGPLQG